MIATTSIGHLRRPSIPFATTATALAIGIAVVGSPIGLAWSFEKFDYDVWGAFVWGPVLIVAAVPLCRSVARRVGEPEITLFLVGAAVLKIIIGSLLRFGTAQAFYGGVADAAQYDNAAAVLAPQLRHLDFRDLGGLSGTRVLEVLTGFVQAAIGETRLGTFFVFSAMGFVGMLLLYLGFCEVVPNGDRTLYRRLLFLTPTIWFWPSSIGKEAFMLLCLGAAFHGGARVLNGHFSGFFSGGLGLWGTLAVRPHLTLAFFLGLLLALPLLARRGEDVHRSPLLRVLPLVALLALPVVIGRVEAFFNLDQLNADTAESVLVAVSDRTGKGGSELESNVSLSPVSLASGSITVVVRPYPWEASGIQGQLSALEAAGVGLLIAYRLTRHRASLRDWLRSRYVRLALGYSIAFIAAFSSVANFGILARQRSLLLPILFVVLAIGGPGTADSPRPRAGAGVRARA